MAPGALIANNEDYFARVKKGGYAKIGDYSNQKHAASVDCNLTVLPIRFYPSNLGFAMQENFPYLQLFNNK